MSCSCQIPEWPTLYYRYSLILDYIWDIYEYLNKYVSRKKPPEDIARDINYNFSQFCTLSAKLIRFHYR